MMAEGSPDSQDIRSPPWRAERVLEGAKAAPRPSSPTPSCSSAMRSATRTRFAGWPSSSSAVCTRHVPRPWRGGPLDSRTGNSVISSSPVASWSSHGRRRSTVSMLDWPPRSPSRCPSSSPTRAICRVRSGSSTSRSPGWADASSGSCAASARSCCTNRGGSTTHWPRTSRRSLSSSMAVTRWWRCACRVNLDRAAQLPRPGRRCPITPPRRPAARGRAGPDAAAGCRHAEPRPPRHARR